MLIISSASINCSNIYLGAISTRACLAEGVIPCWTIIMALLMFSSCMRPQYLDNEKNSIGELHKYRCTYTNICYNGCVQFWFSNCIIRSVISRYICMQLMAIGSSVHIYIGTSLFSISVPIHEYYYFEVRNS